MDRKTVTTESLNYIENNIKNKITIDEISGNAGYTKFYFSRLFKQEMKVSVMEYVRERKLIYATREILNGNKILDVAIEYGWESHSGFIKAFKSYYGFSIHISCLLWLNDILKISSWMDICFSNVALNIKIMHSK